MPSCGCCWKAATKKRDDEAGQLVEAETPELERSLVLPERSPLDPPINPDLPLKIAFSTVRVARSDPAEHMLVNMLLNWNTNLITATEAMLFPIFGRGRVVPPAIGKEIRAEAIREMAEFLTGPCSCVVKEVNPGYDLLLAANWSSLAGYQEVMVPESPPLVEHVAVRCRGGDEPHPVAHPARPFRLPLQQSHSPGSSPTPPLVRNVIVVLGIGVSLPGRDDVRA